MKALVRFSIVIEVTGDLENLDMADIDIIGESLSEGGTNFYSNSKTMKTSVKGIKADVNFTKVII